MNWRDARPVASIWSVRNPPANDRNLRQAAVRRAKGERQESAQARQVGRLLQGAVRRTEAGAALSVPVHPTGSPSRTAASSRPTTPASRSAGRIIASPGRTAGRRCGFTRTSSSGAFSCTCCPGASTASATTGSSPTPTAPTNIAKARALLGAEPPAADPQPQPDVTPDAPRVAPCPCPRCGARMIVIEVFARGCAPRWRPTPSGFDTS